MEVASLEQLKYPIGKFQAKAEYSETNRISDIELIATLPARLSELVRDFTEDQFNTPYRTDGWTVRQLIHHLADSHLHAWIRIKWALTEDCPTIKAYDEKLWASTPDNVLPASISLAFLTAHHARWSETLRTLKTDDWLKSFVHPVTGAKITIERMLQLYSWHGAHHFAHILRLKSERSW